MLRSCSHFPQRCELPAECQPRSSSWGGATWSEGDSPLPLRSREGSSLLPQVVPRQARVLPLHAQRGAGHKSLQHHRYLRWRKCQYTFSPLPFPLADFACKRDISACKVTHSKIIHRWSKISTAPSVPITRHIREFEEKIVHNVSHSCFLLFRINLTNCKNIFDIRQIRDLSRVSFFLA